jgi:ribonucleoside-diphosphate reductase alpha chain
MHDAATGVNPCAEICLESYENCVISDVAPAKCVDEYGNFSPKLFYEALQLATLITSTIVLIPTESDLTNAVIGRNRRIGVSLTGIADWWANNSTSKLISWLNTGYAVVRAENLRLAREAGVPASVRVTTVKPSGTVSLLAGVSSGIHPPQYSRYYRRVRIGKSSPILPLLIEANIPVEDDVMAPNDTAVLTFAVDQGKVRGAKDISVFEKAAHVQMFQRFFADNSVSVTITYDPEREANSLEHMLAQTIPYTKTLSVLPIDNGSYPQMPIEQTTLENVNRWKRDVREVDWSKFIGSDGNSLTDAYCSNDSCAV